jgi:hypothetical protein
MFATSSSARRSALLSPLVSPLLALLMAAAAQPAAAQSAEPAAAASAPAGPTVRPEVGNPLNAAQALIRASNGKEALAKIGEAEGVANLTAYEQHNINHTKAVAALAAGDPALSLAQFEKVLASPFLPEKDKLSVTETAARLAIQTKVYPKALALLKSYRQLGGNDEQLQRVQAQLLAETGDYPAAIAESKAMVQADTAAGRKPNEQVLRVLGFSQQKASDIAGYTQTLELLVQHYPTPEYWGDLISRIVRKPGFADDRLRIDVYRLQRALGIALMGDELADMAQRALLSGLPGEAQKLIEEGYAAGLLGKGPDASAHAKLRDQANKAAAADQKQFADAEAAALKAKEGTALVNLGMAIAGTGAFPRAATLMEQGVAKGGLRRPDEGALRLGYVQWRAGRTDDALKTLANVQGTDGSADIARLWTYHLKQQGATKKG